MNFQIFKLHLEKAEEPQIKLPMSIGSSKKQEGSRKRKKKKKKKQQHTSALLTMPKSLTVWITKKLKNSSMGRMGMEILDGNTRPPDLPPEKYVCRSRSNS